MTLCQKVIVLVEAQEGAKSVTVKNLIIIVIITTAAGFAAGRYLTPEKVRVETQTVEVKKYVQQKSNVTTVTVEKPDGSKETTIIDRTVLDEKTASLENQEAREDTTRKKTNVSALMTVVGGDRAYGVSATREIVGPFTVGVFGLTTPTVGISFGVNF